MDQARRTKSDLLQELATRSTAGTLDVTGWLGLLPDPDPVLRARGEYAEVLEGLTADDQVAMAMQARRMQVYNRREYSVSPGRYGEEEPSPLAEACSQALQRDLWQIDLANVTAQVLEAPYYGLTVAELLWRPEGSRLRLADIVPKPRRWFGYDGHGRLVFQGESVRQPEPVPVYKFAVARHFPSYENPYGLRLLSRCLWPVAFKRGGVQFWMRFAERYGMPWVVAEAPAGADRPEMDRIAGMLASMVQDAVAVVRHGSKVTLAEGSAARGELYAQIVRQWDAAISKVLMGQTLTAEVGKSGSYAAAKTHYGMLGDLADADAALVTAFYNEVAWAYTRVNYGEDVASPTFNFVDPDDLEARATLDTKLHGMGVRFTPSYFQRRYGLAEDEFRMEPGVAPESSPEHASESPGALAAADTCDTEFATAQQVSGAKQAPGAQQEPGAGQAAADALADEALVRAQPLSRALDAVVLGLVRQAETPEELQLLLAELLGDESETAAFEALLGKALLHGDLTGRWATTAEASQTQAPTQVQAQQGAQHG